MNGFGMFNCSNLAEINVDSNNQEYSSRDGVLFNKNCSKLLRFPSAKNITDYEISNIQINWDAFSGNKFLKNIVISECGIYNRAFSNCKSLENITFLGKVSWSGYYTFSGCNKLMSIEIPEGMTSITLKTFYYCDNLTELVIPNSIKFIDKEACQGCKNLENITFKGTINEWKNITKASGWNLDVPCTTVKCIDGDTPI